MDRFQIATAYYWYAYLWHAGGLTNRCHAQGRSISAQLHRMEFRIAPNARAEDMDEIELDIYCGLVDRYEGEK